MGTQLIAKLTAIPLAFLLGGYGFNASQNSVPSLKRKSATTSTPIFAEIYLRGINPIVGGCSLSAIAFAFLAYTTPARRTLYIVATTLVISPLPVTRTILLPGIHRLLEISQSPQAEQATAEARGEVDRLIQAWIAQNWIRVGLYVGAGLTGLWAALCEPMSMSG